MFQTLTIKTLLLFCCGSIVFAVPAMYTTPDGNTYFAPNNSETRRFKLIHGKEQDQGRVADVYPVVDVDTGKEFLLKRSKKEGDIGEHEIDFVRKHGFLESVLSENEFVMKILPGETLNEYYDYNYGENMGPTEWNSYVHAYYQAYLMTKELHKTYGQMHYDLHTGNIMAESDVNGTIVAMRAIDFGNSVPLHDEIRRILPMLKKRHPNLTNKQCIEHAREIALAYDFRHINSFYAYVLDKYFNQIRMDPKIKEEFRKRMERMQSDIDEFGLWSPYEMLYVYKPETYAELKMQYDMALNMVVDIQRKTGRAMFNFDDENIRVQKGRLITCNGMVIGSLKPTDLTRSQPIDNWVQFLKESLKEQYVQKTDEELESTARSYLVAADFHKLAKYFSSLLPDVVGVENGPNSIGAKIGRIQSHYKSFNDIILSKPHRFKQS